MLADGRRVFVRTLCPVDSYFSGMTLKRKEHGQFILNLRGAKRDQGYDLSQGRLPRGK